MTTDADAAQRPGRSRGRLWSDGIAAIMLLALLVLLVKRLEYYPEVGFDESASVLGISLLHGHFGNHLDPFGLFYSRYASMDCYPPVFYLLQAIIFRVAGFGVVQSRIASAFFLVATGALCFGLARRIGGWQAGLFAVAAYLYVPILVYVLLARPDVGVSPFLLASFWMLLRAREQGDWRWFGAAGLAFSGAFLSHFSGLVAGPAFAVLLVASVWRHRRRWRLLASFVVCAVLPLLGYARLIHPYEGATLWSLYSYRLVGESGAGGWAQRWPLRSTLQHVAVLRAYYPLVLLGWLPVALASLLSYGVFTRFRRRFGREGVLVVAMAVALFVLVGAYPNIATYAYYGPVYLGFAAVAGGCIWSAVIPSGRAGNAVAIGVPVLLAAVLLQRFEGQVRADILSVGGMPLTAAADWASPIRSRSARAFAPPHWVFFLDPEKTTTPSVLQATTGTVGWEPELLDYAPGLAAVDSYDELITDAYSEFSDLADLVSRLEMDQRIRLTGRLLLRERAFRATKIFFDPWRWSTNAVRWQRARADVPLVEWPDIAAFVDGKIRDLHIEPPCFSAMASAIPIEVPLPGRAGMRLAQFTIRWPKEPAGDSLFLRLTLEGDLPQPVFAMFHPNASQGGLADSALGNGQQPTINPPQGQVALVSSTLSNGARGRDLMVRAQPQSSVLSVFTIGTGTRVRVGAGVPLQAGQPCTPALTASTRAVAAHLLGPPPVRVVDSPKSVAAGEPIVIQLSMAAKVEFVVFRMGTVVQREHPAVSDRPSLTIPAPGDYGIEVWVTDPDTGERSVVAVLVTVRG